LQGGIGNDTYIVDTNLDVVTEAFNEGTDTVQSSVDFTLTTNVENLTLVGLAINGSGNTDNNTITGNSQANTLDGGAGGDTLIGGLGDDVYIVDNSLDVVTEALNEGIDTVQSSVTYTLVDNIENLMLTGNGLINGIGNAGNNNITGNSAANTLNGGAGADTMVGGAGNDIYVVDNLQDVVTEVVNEGTDLVQSSITYTLGSNVENLTLTDNVAINGTGNVLSNLLTGNSAANTLAGDAGNDTLIGNEGDDWLDGGAGSDTMLGGIGNDTFVIDVATDVITELFNEGIDTVQASVDYTLATNVENLTLIGLALNGTGNADSNIITGNSTANILNGGAGVDRLIGGLGNDTYVVDNSLDVVIEAFNEGIDTVQSNATYTLADNTENLTLTGALLINGTGNADNNSITGNSAANILNGGAGVDTMSGGAGNDTYIVDNGLDVVTEALSAGIDTVQAGVNYTLGTNVENLTLIGLAIIGTGSVDGNILTGNSAANILDGGAGIDTLIGGLGDDIYVVDNSLDLVTEALNEGIDLVQSTASYTLAPNLENLTLLGAGTINGTGNALNNILIGNSAINTLTGGAGDDTYVISTGDVVVEAAGAGIDTVQSDVTYSLALNVENLTLIGFAAINATGNLLNNVLIGNSAVNILTGGAGNDTYMIGLGDSVVEAASAGTDTVQADFTYTLGTNVENLTLLGSAAINGTGNTLSNILVGNSAANTLSGGTGGDTLIGGAGDDFYVVENLLDVVTEALNEGTDLVQSTATYTLTPNVENLILSGTGIINGIGNTGANIIIGNSAANILDGGAGADSLFGGAGNDTYMVDDLFDTVTEGLAAGTDTVQSGITYSLGDNVENLTLTGTNVINGTGNILNNILTGNSAANILDGGAGANTLIGGLGDDTYILDSLDVVTELLNAGIDTVQASITYTLGTNVENLVLTGNSIINGTGNGLSNVLTGNSAANTLSGGVGIDKMIGGAGDDIYIVDNLQDVVTEAFNEGTDLIQSSVSYTLSANVENLLLTGTAALGTGNDLDNILTGNASVNTLTGGAGNDYLDGLAGGDTLKGGTGNDTYVVNVLADNIIENLNEGSDNVITGITYTLGTNLENLNLTGTAAVNGTGNILDNIIVGNSGANKLNGGAGNDVLTGGAGVDHFQFTTALVATNIDTLTDFVSGTDKIDLSKAIFTAFSAVTVGGTLAATEIGNHLLYNATTGALSYDADGSAGAGGAVQIAFVGSASHPAALQGIDFNIAA
jgi:Ca2+-binding RTX toxin-like protein